MRSTGAVARTPAASTRPWSVGGSAAIFVVPIACTAILLLLVKRASAHANWAAGTVLVLTVGYLLFSQAAMALPTQLACGCIK